MRVLNSSELCIASGGDGVCTAGPNGEVVSSTAPAPTSSPTVNFIYDMITFPIKVVEELVDSVRKNN